MKFTWDNFDNTFLKEIIKASDVNGEFEVYLNSDDKDILIACMNMICEVPDKRFIQNYRQIIEQYVLVYYPDEIKKICNAANITSRSFNEKQAMMTKKPLTATLINAYITALYNISGMEQRESSYSSFKYTRSLNMRETQIEEVPLYDFQKDAVGALKQHFLEEDRDAGMLVMPTGSGKSRTATCFLIQEMISRGYQVIWLVHRHMLIDQAADCFFRFAGLSKIENPNIRNYRISCISGEHLRISQVDKNEVIVASINSVCRNKEHLRRVLGKKVMVVVDEAHHTFAPTYRETIHFIKKCRRNAKLLGITATPIRSSDKESKALLNLYDNEIIYSVSMSNLIAKGILATPKHIRIDTGENFEPIISIDEERLIRKYGELPETLVNKIATTNSRNDVIIQEYIKNQDKYGKTLIFALNILHCRILYEEFTKLKIPCGYIHSGKEDNSSIIQDFREGKVKVLINVNIMTEGTDVPDIETVFLTRPTQSEGLLMQMIGRGMRGIYASGTEFVNIVDFHDKWAVFNNWLNPEWILDETTGPVEPLEKAPAKKRTYIEFEWRLCLEIYKSMAFKCQLEGKHIMLPVGWYSLIDEDGEIVRMLLFENQIDGLLKMMQEKTTWLDDDTFTAKTAIRKYFADFAEKPSEYEMSLLLDNLRNNEIMPTRHLLENRKNIDPYYVAKKADNEGLDLFELAGETYEKYPLVQDLYETKEEYIRKVCDAKIYNGKVPVIGQKIEELPEELIPYDRTPAHELTALYEKVVDEMFGGKYEGIGAVTWTNRPYKTFFARFWRDSHNIEVNCVLNSKDVPEEVIKYLLYHEMLHRDFPNHGPAFRYEEHKYHKFEEWDYFLDGEMRKFDIKEW